MIRLTASAFTLLLLAFSSLSAADPQPGDRAAARWTDSNFYLATVLAVNGTGIEVLFDDGDKATVAKADTLVIVRDAPFAIGDQVLAAWKNAAMFPGEVTAVTPFTITVKWADGDEPLEVARTRVVAAPK